MKPLKSLRTIGTLGLTMAGITSIIGSGWLFGAYNAAKIAGPASIFSWVIGGTVILLMGLTIIELAILFPKTGGMARYLNYSHGSLAGFLSGWANWLAIVSVIPAEATASIQYLSSWHFNYFQVLFNSSTGQLTNWGVLAAMGLVFIYFLINFWTVKLLMRFITAITIIKIAVPLLTIIILFYTSFHSGNFYSHEFAPYGWSSVLTAISTCGIIFAFNGFQTPLNFAGEAKNPHISLPIAVILAILVTLFIYVLLQIAFISAISPDLLISQSWKSLTFSSPFADLAISLNLNVLLLTLYADAFISPSATGMTYMGTTARMLYGMEKHGHVPHFLGQLHEKYLIPRGALWVNLIVSLIFLYFCRSWSGLAAVISVATLFTYLTGPVCVMGLRKLSLLKNQVKIPFLSIIAPVVFILVSLVFFWSCWPLTGEIIAVLSVGLLVYCYYEHKNGWKDFTKQFKGALWLVIYLICMAILSYLGDDAFGGINILPAVWDQVIVAFAALFFYYWGVHSAWKTPELAEFK